MKTNAPILLTGANGQVGHELTRLATHQGRNVVALTRGQLDIGDADAVNQIVAVTRPSLVINGAAYTAVDKAETEPEVAMRANRQGPANLAMACQSLEIPLIHLSTDYIFDGCKAGAYREDDTAAPTGIYGLSKWEGEQEVRARLSRHLIIRVSWVFGPHGNNFVKTMLRLAAERDELRVVADQHGCPTSATDIAHTLLNLADQTDNIASLDWGTYHYCGTPKTTWHGFAEAIIQEGIRLNLLERAIPVHPITTSQYPTPAKRPENSALDCSKIMQAFAIQPPDWRQGLASMLTLIKTEKQIPK
jgi:dTDP-4-dehydrorhamnose reductase